MEHSRSQSKEDEYAFREFFKGKQGGIYLEMGALDGVKFSNTIAFDKFLGWKGVLIEPDPDSFSRLKTNRPGNANFHAAICNECRQVNFARNKENAVGGIYEFMSDRFKRVWFPRGNTNPYPIACLPLHEVLAHAGVAHVNFWSLDVEGAELSVLVGIDWNVFSFDVLTMESNTKVGKDGKNVDEHTVKEAALAKALLTEKGYDLHTVANDPDPRNLWFVRRGVL